MDFYRKVLVLEQKYSQSSAGNKNAIQTNGTLLDEKWAAFFKENDFKVGLSLDGPEDIHDAYRRYPSKEGSFKDVMWAIRILNKHGKSFGIVATINEKSLRYPEKFLDFFDRNGLISLSVNPHLNRSTYSARQYAGFMCRLFDTWLAGEQPEIQISIFEELIKAFLGMSHSMCWWNGRCPRIIRIDQKGDVWPCCDRYLPFTQYKLGNIRQNTLSEILAGTVYLHFRDTFGRPHIRCTGCKWNHICKGGCAYHRLMNGRGEDGGDHLCEAYRQIFQYVSGRCQDLGIKPTVLDSKVNYA